MTIPHTDPRERTVTAAERARLVQCSACWQRPGRRCTRFYPPGDHLARFVTAEERGLITRAKLAAVIAGLDVIAGCVLIPDVTP